MSLHWSDLDVTSVPVPRDEIASVEADGELVLYDPIAGRAHVLNPTAATVWQVLDGEVDVTTLAGEIAETFDVGVDEVTDQLLVLVQDLGRLGLLADVEGQPVPEAEVCP